MLVWVKGVILLYGNANAHSAKHTKKIKNIRMEGLSYSTYSYCFGHCNISYVREHSETKKKLKSFQNFFRENKNNFFKHPLENLSSQWVSVFDFVTYKSKLIKYRNMSHNMWKKNFLYHTNRIKQLLQTRTLASRQTGSILSYGFLHASPGEPA